MLKKAAQKRTIRSTTAVLEFPADDGSVHQETVTVEYYSPTTAEQEAWFAHLKKVREEDPERIVWTAERLHLQIHSLTDTEGERLDHENGELSLEWLKELTTPNIEAIEEAIKADIKGKSTSTK